MNRRAGGGRRRGTRRALVAVALLTVLALAATFFDFPWRKRAQPPEPLPPTPLDWQARIAPLAGDGHRGVRDGHLLQARFDEPWGLVRGPDGSLFVADGGEANRIRRIAPDGTVSTFAGSSEGFSDGDGREAKFHTPSALAVDLFGNLYVADTGNHAIRRISPQGRVTTLAGDGVRGSRDGPAGYARFDAPMGVAVDFAGRIYVADTWNDRVRVIEPGGLVRTLAGGEGRGHVDARGAQARFDTPTALALDRRGRLWVADTGNGAIRWIAPDGAVRSCDPGAWAAGAAGGGRPLSLAATHDGQLYVGDLSPGRIRQIDCDGRRARILAGMPPRPFARPSALWLEPDGSLLLADAAGHRLHGIVPRRGDAPALADGPVGPSPVRALPATGQRWPFAPQDGWHEIAGTMGEVRGNFSGQSRSHLHNGLDIREDVGTPVLALAEAKVTSPLAAWSFGGQAEGLAIDDIGYVHMRVGRSAQGRALDPARFRIERDERGRATGVRVARGTRFRAGEAIGTLNAQAHVHLIVGPAGHQLNAHRLGFRNFSDRVPPRIERVFLLDAHDLPLTRRGGDRVLVARDGGGVQIVADAWDQVDGNLPRRRLGLHRLGYQVLRADGSMLPDASAPLWTQDYARMPAHPDAVKIAYAASSGITVHGAARTRFLYVVSNIVRGDEARVTHWQPADLPPGDYLIRVFAEDASGNAATGVLPVTVVDTLPPMTE